MNDMRKNVTPAMLDWFVDRTNRHIFLVGKYCRKIAEKFPEFSELNERLKVHDASKFEEPEIVAYVWITWKYKCIADGVDFNLFNPPENLEKLMYAATEHHVLNNSHHPECTCGKKSGIIRRSNREAPNPDEIIDATNMTNLDISEMCADWLGVSEEKGNTAKAWADKNVGVRWRFTKDQEELIYKILSAFP